MGNLVNFQLDLKTNKLSLLSSKRRSKNFKLVLKNSKKNLNLSVLCVLRSRNNDLIFHANLKSSPSVSKKPVVKPLLKSNSTSDVKPKWPNSDVISKNLTSHMKPKSQLFARSKPIPTLKCRRPLTIFNVSSK